MDAIEAWAKDIKDFALVQARDHGVKFPGWKLVEGRSTRRYTDPDKIAVETLRAAKYRVKDIFKTELIGISAMAETAR